MIWLAMLGATVIVFAASGIMWCALWIAEKLGL